MAAGANAERARQFSDIAAKMNRIVAMLDDIKHKTAMLDDTQWAFTGRGSDLARIQHDLAVVLGEE